MNLIKTLSTLVLLALSQQLLTQPAQAHGGEDHSHSPAPLAQATGEQPRRLSDGSLYIPKSAQQLWQLRTRLVKAATLPQQIELQGKVIVDPAFAGLVEAAQLGVLSAGPDGWPTLGQSVQAGQVLAYLQPVDTTLDRSNQQALLAELDAQIALAKDRVQRFSTLGALVPRNELTTAQIELKGLQARRSFAAKGTGAGLAVIAPVAGVVSTVFKQSGQVVDSRDALFQIINPAQLLVEALAYPALPAHGGLNLSADSHASARFPAAAESQDSHAFSLSFRGKSLQLQQQAQPLWFGIDSSKPAATLDLTVGQPLLVEVATGKQINGMTVPRSALQKLDNGETAVWVHQAAERFIAQKVRVEPYSASEVVVVSGLHDGDRVVVQAASLLAQVR
jgi:RND family efflux transporter MFP subunit